jgi:hypothetical protein
MNARQLEIVMRRLVSERPKGEFLNASIHAVSGVLMAATMSGCTMTDSVSIGDEQQALTRIEGDEFDHTLRGRGLAWGHDSINTSGHRIIELFCRDGRWFKLGGSHPVSGQYVLANATVCVRSDIASGEQSCREIRRNSSDQAFTLERQGNGLGSPYPVTVYEYSGGERQLCGE